MKIWSLMVKKDRPKNPSVQSLKTPHSHQSNDQRDSIRTVGRIQEGEFWVQKEMLDYYCCCLYGGTWTVGFHPSTQYDGVVWNDFLNFSHDVEKAAYFSEN